MRFLYVVLAAMLFASLLTAQSWAQETNSKDKTATFESKTDTTKSETDIGKRLDNAAGALPLRSALPAVIGACNSAGKLSI